MRKIKSRYEIKSVSTVISEINYHILWMRSRDKTMRREKLKKIISTI